MIKILYGYKRHGMEYIPIGVYADNDSVLNGLGDYLVNNGHAMRIENPAIEPFDADTEVLPTTRKRNKRNV